MIESKNARKIIPDIQIINVDFSPHGFYGNMFYDCNTIV